MSTPERLDTGADQPGPRAEADAGLDMTEPTETEVDEPFVPSPLARARCGFLHIPKAAGTSIRTAMVRAYGTDNLSPFVFDEVLFGDFSAWHTVADRLAALILHPGQHLTDADRSMRAVAGHLSYRSITSLVDAADVFTVLREPRSRVLSHQLFWSVMPEFVAEEYGEYQVHRTAFDGLKRFLADPAAAHQSDNLHVRMLADLDIDPTRPLSAHERDDAASAALATLGRLGCTTFVESPSFWRDIATFVGLEGDEIRENITGSGNVPTPFGGPQFDHETIEMLDERTAADSIVYRRVVAAALGLDERGAAAFADRIFLMQVERYGRVLARAEMLDDLARVTAAAAPPPPPPAPDPEPEPEPVPEPRVRTGLGILARRIIRAARGR
ncbi:MAG: hypothetical protein ACO3C1_00340 [Ilumatobacteraceae bacterium]